ncbi:ABSCISIC ACID-INSENSITIVE 5-like protein 5 [Selaginella moellendorffii]|uniref:ABSCISIC ACID-INSENSITIVE 5-like protein 5 n=1 Tax=Selaginella moellendorffii TaxID=88036 RepID=UPI000D1C6C83|nr:ABSCISIC ACID-INSENSITIVE 5-like protein 5 [Selaginella moellendorffii]XP_024531536.1 ABSCISIC ACID-INSENSITIVE 5-like protein 5 [Selaginella moellendorffii]|eukprot:XP_002970746.2 ABSCISIC ACID-INSENSITIVE 5-like protein 5 [Selaginella moellendorffii]
MASSKTMLHPPPNGGVGPQRSGLGRQGSIYSLTLEELQNSMLDQGKIGSMNMDEFMKNVWTAEENQGGAANTNTSTATSTATDNPPAPSSLQRQSSVSIPRTLSQKTVDEVWKEIQVQKQQQQQQDLSYGEMTLEDFLIRAGVVKEDTDATSGGVVQAIGPQGTIPNSIDSMAQNPDWYNYQVKQQQLMHQAADLSKRPNLIVPAGHPGAFFDAPYDAVPSSLALSPGMATPEAPGKKRSLDLVVEKTVERRQRRMIKNRESAARSRARKQAYTVELEAELTQLKEENTRLKRWQAEEAERRRKQITEVFLPVTQQDQQQHANASSQKLQRCRSFP